MTKEEDGVEIKVQRDGAKHWYLHGVLHRDDGPAVERPNGEKWWFQFGKHHREDGPALERMVRSNGFHSCVLAFLSPFARIMSERNVILFSKEALGVSVICAVTWIFAVRVVAHWEHDTECAAFVRSAFDSNVASMRFDKRLRQTETQSISAGRAAPISTIESIKDMGKVVFLDPDASVRHGNLYLRSFAFN